jgi:DNA-binding NtrC family response regulator
MTGGLRLVETVVYNGAGREGSSGDVRVSVPGGSDPLTGAQVLVVEDEMLITMLLEDILQELGCEVAGSAVNVRQAEDLITSTPADAAILDVNLGGDPVFPIAERLLERQIPFVFASGYGSANLPDRWRSHPTLPKPFTAEQVASALRGMLSR